MEFGEPPLEANQIHPEAQAAGESVCLSLIALHSDAEG